MAWLGSHYIQPSALQEILRKGQEYASLRRMEGGSLHPFLRPISEEDTISL